MSSTKQKGLAVEDSEDDFAYEEVEVIRFVAVYFPKPKEKITRLNHKMRQDIISYSSL